MVFYTRSVFVALTALVATIQAIPVDPTSTSLALTMPTGTPPMALHPRSNVISAAQIVPTIDQEGANIAQSPDELGAADEDQAQVAQSPDELGAADEDQVQVAQEPDEGGAADEEGASIAQAEPDASEVAEGPEEMGAAGDDMDGANVAAVSNGHDQDVGVAQYGNKNGGYGGGHRKRNRFLFTRYHSNRIRDRILLRNRVLAGKKGGQNHNYGNVYYHKKTTTPYAAYGAYPGTLSAGVAAKPACIGSCSYGADSSAPAAAPIGGALLPFPPIKPDEDITYRKVHNIGSKNTRSGMLRNRVRNIRATRDNFNKNNFIYWK
ncbi:hypothetical protein HDU76_003725 [Blyttiomyces sp. JEL0837]|nr:hypothetical protein HDU76_003725 [Blyttiomyces sp. JEL0837]